MDTGDILFSDQIVVPSNLLTFREVHTYFIKHIEELFINKWPEIQAGQYKLVKQNRVVGSEHKYADLPRDFLGWDTIIVDEISRLKG